MKARKPRVTVYRSNGKWVVKPSWMPESILTGTFKAAEQIADCLLYRQAELQAA